MLLFLKQDNPPAPKLRDFGEPLEHRVQAEGAEGAVAAAQPHQWNQLLLFSFILVFFFYPPGAANAVVSPGKAPGTEAHGYMVGSQELQEADHC